jgi:serine O-acetyltransferase
MLRLQYFFVLNKVPYLPNLMRMKMVKSFGFDIAPGASIGSGLKIQHPVGIVIGASARIGDQYTIMQNVTIGERFVDYRSDGKCPIIGNNVVIGISAIIVGDITVGNDIRILANSIILASTPDGRSISGLFKCFYFHHIKRKKSITLTFGNRLIIE